MNLIFQFKIVCHHAWEKIMQIRFQNEALLVISQSEASILMIRDPCQTKSEHEAPPKWYKKICILLQSLHPFLDHLNRLKHYKTYLRIMYV